MMMLLRVCQHFHYQAHFQGFKSVEWFNNTLCQIAVLGEEKKISIIIQKERQKDSLLMKAVTDVLSARK